MDWRTSSRNRINSSKTKKKIVTIQELDVQLRNYLNEKYKLYEQGGDIVKGYVKYHNDDEQNIEYNFYNLNGEYGYEILKCMLIIKLSIVTNCI